MIRAEVDTDKGPRPYHVSATRAVAPELRVHWQPADWREPQYPGDAIMRVDLTRGDEIGDVRVQWYDDGILKVGSFTPGYEQCSPGDTPKFWPDKDAWIKGDPAQCKADASKQLVHFLIAAFRDGWRIKPQWRPCRKCTDPFDCGSWATCMNGGNK